MQHQTVTLEARPSRAQIEPAALELLSRHSAGLLATARRYSATTEDAEDAYQRGVEVLLTKAPDDDGGGAVAGLTCIQRATKSGLAADVTE